MRQIEIRTDVTDAAGIGESLETVATVCLPDQLSQTPVVCFAWPGGGYSRQYFTFDMPGSTGGGEAGWHTDRGWIFVAVDTLNTGESSKPADPGLLTYANLGASMKATVDGVLSRLENGTIAEGFPRVVDPVKIALGQSLGGSLVVLCEGQQHIFDGIGVLGFSGHHTMIWAPPELVTGSRVYIPRGTNVAALTEDVFVAAMPEMAFDDRGWPLCAPGFHFEDEPQDIVAADMLDYPRRKGILPVWASATIPPCAMTMMSPGAIAPEAANVRVPVFVGVGERDTVPNPKSEPTAYQEASDVTVYICEGMAHMHNFGTPRALMWTRFHSWAEGVVAMREVSRRRTVVAVG
jgi:pimeloyl-ACP methyl ester carboxylesterase